jgi:glycosyltransferase involved in cell wall biosynthesis
LFIVILSWEFPPKVVGEIAYYVNRLAIELVKNQVDVNVITHNDLWTGFHQGSDGVKAYRVSNPIKTHLNILTWDLTLMSEFERVFSDIYYDTNGKIDVIDAQEWLCVVAAIALKKAFDIPFIFTIHSLEDHRTGQKNPFTDAIKSIEWQGTYEADRIIVNSSFMKNEVNRIYKTNLKKIDVIRSDSSDWCKDVLKTYIKTKKSFGS